MVPWMVVLKIDAVPHVKLITKLSSLDIHMYLHTLLHGSQATSAVDDNMLIAAASSFVDVTSYTSSVIFYLY